MENLKYLLIFLFFFGCTKGKKISDSSNQIDSISIFLSRAEDNSLTNATRKYYCRRALHILKEQPNDSIKRENIFRIARNFILLNEWTSLKRVSDISLSHARDANNISHIARAYHFLGLYHKNIEASDSAFYYYLKAEKIFVKQGDEKSLAKLYLDQSGPQIDVFDIFGAEQSGIKSLKLFRKIGDKLGEYDALINLGIIYNSSEDYIKSNSYYFKALQLVEKENYPDSFFLKEIVLNNIGNNFLYAGSYRRAAPYFIKALSSNNIRKINPRLYSIIVDNLAYSMFRANPNNKVSLDLFLRSLKIKDSLNLYSKIIYTQNHLSEYYFANKDMNKSLNYAKNALSLSRETGRYYDLIGSLKQMSIVDSKNYNLYAKEYIDICESLYRKNRISRNKFAVIAYETEELTNQKDQAVKRNWIISICAGSLILILVLLFIIKMQRARQKRLQLLQIQQKANEEIYNLLLDQQNKIDVGRQIEKKRIAQDLHDGILNRLASTRFNLHNLNEKATPEIIKKCLPFIAGIQEIEKEIRSIAHDLNQGALANTVSFVAVVNDFIEEQKKISNINVHLEIDSKINWEALSNFKKIHIFRIIQEAFQNINKHAEAKTVIASILKEEDNLLLEIFDDGKGFSPNKKKKGIGLQNIEARVKSCNGIVEFKSRVNQGTTISVNIPIS